jgi:dTDP-glucose 4,6-dehydratase
LLVNVKVGRSRYWRRLRLSLPLLKLGKKIRRFIHISSSEVYGAALTESIHPLNPMSPYASAKCGANPLVHSYWSTYKLPLVIVRPFHGITRRRTH